MPIVMTSHYSERTEGARLVIERAHDLVDAAIDALPPHGLPVVVDYGAADGGTAMGVWGRMLERLRRRDDVDAVQLLGNDLPFNDFSALSQSLTAIRDGRNDIFIGSLPTSFYEQVMPRSSVSLGFSATAMHWLSKKPLELETHTHANATDDEASRQAFADQAQADWRALMAARSRELRPGGQLVMANLARTDDGLFLGHNGRDRSVHDELHTIWRDLLDEGRLDESAYRRATFQNYYKSLAEFVAVFDDPTAEATRAGMRVRSARTETIRCPYRARFAADGDAKTFARGLMQTVRSWSEHTFKSAVSDSPDGQGMVDELYARLKQRIAVEPEHYSMDYVETYLWLEKRA